MLSEKRGDPQARAELLGELLKQAGFEPYMVQYGSGRDSYHLVVLRETDIDVDALEETLENPIDRIRIGPAACLAFPIDPGYGIGDVPERYYQAETHRWTGSISFRKIP